MQVQFLTPILHINISEEGNVQFLDWNPDQWKTPENPTWVQALVELIENPKVEHSLRPELAEKFKKNPEAFYNEARKHTLAHGVPIQGAATIVEEERSMVQQPIQVPQWKLLPCTIL